jgi:hypothetical protein
MPLFVAVTPHAVDVVFLTHIEERRGHHVTDIIANIYARLDALEAVVLGRRDGPRLDPRFDRRLGKKEMALRRGTSTKTLERDVKRGRVPPPEIDEYGHWHWWLSAVQEDERKRAAASREQGKHNPVAQEDATA